jgi:hypothetical protein
MSACGISYAACNAHASYYIVIYGLPGYTFFPPYYVINGTISGRNLIKRETCVLFFLYNFCLKHFSLYAELSEILS